MGSTQAAFSDESSPSACRRALPGPLSGPSADRGHLSFARCCPPHLPVASLSSQVRLPRVVEIHSWKANNNTVKYVGYILCKHTHAHFSFLPNASWVPTVCQAPWGWGTSRLCFVRICPDYRPGALFSAASDSPVPARCRGAEPCPSADLGTARWGGSGRRLGTPVSLVAGLEASQ